MRTDYYIFLSAVSKSAKKFGIVFGMVLLMTSASGLAGTPTPTPDQSPVPTATPDLTQISELPLSEAQKNPNKTYQIGDRISLLIDIKGNPLENGDHLALKVPEGASKLEDQGWYLDPSTQFLNGTFRFVASPIQTGSLTLPTLLITKDDNTVIGRTAAFTVQVTGPDKKGEPELLEITSASLPTKYWILFSLLAVITMGLVAYAVYRFLKNRRKKPKFLPQTPEELDHVRALRKIETLYQEHPYRIDNLKPVVFGISETLKEFFSARFKVDASESTTDEMIELLRKEALTGESLREIQILFQDLDLVKFTKVENYRHFDESKYLDLKVKAQLLVQKWKVVNAPVAAVAPATPQRGPRS